MEWWRSWCFQEYIYFIIFLWYGFWGNTYIIIHQFLIPNIEERNINISRGQDKEHIIYIIEYIVTWVIILQVNIVDPKASSGKAKPIQYLNAAKIACKLKAEEVKYVFPNVDSKDLPYLCMDMIYQFSLLVDGFGKFWYNDVVCINIFSYYKKHITWHKNQFWNKLDRYDEMLL